MGSPPKSHNLQEGVAALPLQVLGPMVVSENIYETESMYVKWDIVLTIQNKPSRERERGREREREGTGGQERDNH